MPWWWNYVFVSLVVGWVIGNFFGKRDAQKTSDQQIYRLKIAHTVDRKYYLDAVGRTVANEMMRRDHSRYLDAKVRAIGEVERISKLTKEACEEELVVFARKHPNLNDFDPFHELRDHILFSDNLTSWGDIEGQYLNLVQFSAMQWVLDENWRGPPTNANDLEHAREYAKRIDDTRLWLRMKVAIDDWRRYRKDAGEPFEGRDFSLHPIMKDGEHRYAVKFKNPVEYGLFRARTGADDYDYAYARSDVLFEKETGVGYQRISGVTLPSPPESF